MTRDEIWSRFAGSVCDHLEPEDLTLEPLMLGDERIGTTITYHRSQGRGMRSWQFDAMAELFGAEQWEAKAEGGRIVVHMQTLEVFDLEAAPAA